MLSSRNLSLAGIRTSCRGCRTLHTWIATVSVSPPASVAAVSWASGTRNEKRVYHRNGETIQLAYNAAQDATGAVSAATLLRLLALRADLLEAHPGSNYVKLLVYVMICPRAQISANRARHMETIAPAHESKSQLPRRVPHVALERTDDFRPTSVSHQRNCREGNLESAGGDHKTWLYKNDSVTIQVRWGRGGGMRWAWSPSQSARVTMAISKNIQQHQQVKEGRRLSALLQRKSRMTDDDP